MMNKEILIFGDIGIDKRKFNCPKNPILVGQVDIDKILTYNKFCLGKKGYKYFISYKHDNNYYKINSLCIILPKMNRYVNNFDEVVPFI